MALINCKECGKEISDKATSCPNCGCPLNIVTTKNQTRGLKIFTGIFGVLISLMVFYAGSLEYGKTGEYLILLGGVVTFIASLIALINFNKRNITMNQLSTALYIFGIVFTKLNIFTLILTIISFVILIKESKEQ